MRAGSSPHEFLDERMVKHAMPPGTEGIDVGHQPVLTGPALAVEGRTPTQLRQRTYGTPAHHGAVCLSRSRAVGRSKRISPGWMPLTSLATTLLDCLGEREAGAPARIPMMKLTPLAPTRSAWRQPAGMSITSPVL
jgi:hypothetical protein